MEEDVPPDPVDVCLLRAAAVVASADGLANAVEKPRLRRAAGTGFTDPVCRSEGVLRQEEIREVADDFAPPFIVRLEHSRADSSQQGVSDG